MTEASTHYGRRVLISGPPNSLKTTATMTWPPHRHHVSYPSEKGVDTLGKDNAEQTVWTWEYEDPAKVSPHATVTAIETLTLEILAGKHGPCETFVGDGLHKLYGWYLARAWIDCGADADDLKGGMAYGRAHRDFQKYLDRLLQSPVPYVVCTIWEGRTKDDPADKSKNAQTHIFPDLPGEMAKRVVGEFSVVLYSEVSTPDPQGRIRGTWQIRPAGKVWGVGVKLPPSMAATLPAKIEPDFRKLEPLLRPIGEVPPGPLSPLTTGG